MDQSSTNHQYILVTSDEPWNEIWHTQLHYAFQLSKRFEVIFLGPPDAWNWKHLFRFSLRINHVRKRLHVVTYLNVLPAFLGRLALVLNDRINSILINSSFPGFLRQSASIIWHFDPYRSHLVFRSHPGARHIFHVVDPIAGFNMDEEMARKADLVVVTSPKFISHYTSLNANVIQVGQGADLEFFKTPIPDPELRQLVSYDSILLLGTFSDEIGYPFLKQLANRYSGRLVLIGPDKTSGGKATEELNELRAIPGVTWLGPMPPEKFLPHLRACRVGILAYTYENYERNNLRSPLKVISYLACGKSVISNIDCEIPSLEGKGIFVVRNDEDFFKKLDACMAEGLPFDSSAVEKFLGSVDYQKLLTSLFGKLGQPLPALI